MKAATLILVLSLSLALSGCVTLPPAVSKAAGVIGSLASPVASYDDETGQARAGARLGSLLEIGLYGGRPSEPRGSSDQEPEILTPAEIEALK